MKVALYQLCEIVIALSLLATFDILLSVYIPHGPFPVLQALYSLLPRAPVFAIALVLAAIGLLLFRPTQSAGRWWRILLIVLVLITAIPNLLPAVAPGAFAIWLPLATLMLPLFPYINVLIAVSFIALLYCELVKKIWSISEVSSATIWYLYRMNWPLVIVIAMVVYDLSIHLVYLFGFEQLLLPRRLNYWPDWSGLKYQVFWSAFWTTALVLLMIALLG